MSKHISSDVFIQLPSGNKVHPYRLIVKDGSFMWKHALNYRGMLSIPQCQAHEAHIIKTAQRLEELNSWVSQPSEPWDCFNLDAWYIPGHPELSEGISLYFNYANVNINKVYNTLLPHIQDHEKLELRNTLLYFQRC